VPDLETNVVNRPEEELSVEKSTPKSMPDTPKTSTAQKAQSSFLLTLEQCRANIMELMDKLIVGN